MSEALKTVFYERYVSLGAKITEFGGWDMPLQFPAGIVQEHLATRVGAGLFDVSHMGPTAPWHVAKKTSQEGEAMRTCFRTLSDRLAALIRSSSRSMAIS